ncbi:hypothetical protein DFP97_12825 [Paenibacillus prosopidis]|uniref:Uncharacterized protein n=1 Tax=Paenibacillus prosopidis TaxID=630520 RepID=A0A368VK44_9BACL|nr:hypothetical protein DFP97_12825 [Paenibacillus prosopidis]
MQLCCISISLLMVLSACGNRNISAEDVQKALQHQGLEVTKINLGTAEQYEGSSLQLNGVFPEAFELALPAADMANREFVFIYEYSSEEECKSANQSGGISSLRMVDLHPNIRQKKNVVVIYWSHNKENPLMINQFTKAMDEF